MTKTKIEKTVKSNSKRPQSSKTELNKISKDKNSDRDVNFVLNVLYPKLKKERVIKISKQKLKNILDKNLQIMGAEKNKIKAKSFLRDITYWRMARAGELIEENSKSLGYKDFLTAYFYHVCFFDGWGDCIFANNDGVIIMKVELTDNEKSIFGLIGYATVVKLQNFADKIYTHFGKIKKKIKIS